MLYDCIYIDLYYFYMYPYYTDLHVHVVMVIMAENNNKVSDNNYSFYQANIILPRVTTLSPQVAKTINVNLTDEEDYGNPFRAVSPYHSMKKMSNEQFKKYNTNDDGIQNIENQNKKSPLPLSPLPLSPLPLSPLPSRVDNNCQQPLKQKRSKQRIKTKNKILPSEFDSDIANDNLFIPRPPVLPRMESPKTPRKLAPLLNNNTNKNHDNKQPQCDSRLLTGNKNIFVKNADSPVKDLEDKYIEKNCEIVSITCSSQENLSEIAKEDLLTKDEDLIKLYKDYLDKRYSISDKSNKSGQTSSCSEVSVSSLSDSDGSMLTLNDLKSNINSPSSFEPLYSLPIKNQSKKVKRDLSHDLNKIVITNSKTSTNNDSFGIYQTGSLPDLHSLDRCNIRKVTHVTKNDSEPDSEPGAQTKYKIQPLPPLSGTSKPGASNLYETIDKFSKKDIPARGSHRTFKQIASLITLIPRVPTTSVRSRKDDHHLADILKYLPDRKLKVFVGTWNMKGTKYLPESLDDFLLPPESLYLQDVYLIGTQEGTPFRHEWQLKLQETFGPSHVLMKASNFGVLQLSVFVRRELVWFCSRVEEDTIATRVGHKIKTKGALAMSFSIFGTSFLFITSHFTSHEGKLRDRINDYQTICQNLQLPCRDSKDEDCSDVTNRCDRVFWFGDFNFRVRETRVLVDKVLTQHHDNQQFIIKELLLHDQLEEVRGKIFHGFSEAPINFMPTYKFDVNTDIYDSSSKQRVPSWTDRVLYKSVKSSDLDALCYNSCNTIKNSDHRPVYAIFETIIEPYKSKFVVHGANFDRDIYVEANMRRSAPVGSQDESHVCTII